MNVIQKLKDHKIFKENSLIESTIEKSWMGSPITVKGTLIVKKLNIDDCICEEYRTASDKIYKIRYFNYIFFTNTFHYYFVYFNKIFYLNNIY